MVTGGLADAGEWTLAAREQKPAALGVATASDAVRLLVL